MKNWSRAIGGGAAAVFVVLLVVARFGGSDGPEAGHEDGAEGAVWVRSDLLVASDIVTASHSVAFVDASGGQPRLTVLEASSGRTRWSTGWAALSQPANTLGKPVVASSHVVGLVEERNGSRLAGYDELTGRRTWTRRQEVHAPSTLCGALVCTSEKMASLPHGSFRVVGVDPVTGETRWEGPPASFVAAADEQNVVLIAGKGEQRVLRVDPHTGEILWERTFPEILGTNPGESWRFDLRGGLIVGSGRTIDDELMTFALALDSGRVAWRRVGMVECLVQPPEVVLVCSFGRVLAIEERDGDERWGFDRLSLPPSGPLYGITTDGTRLVIHEGGATTAFISLRSGDTVGGAQRELAWSYVGQDVNDVRTERGLSPWSRNFLMPFGPTPMLWGKDGEPVPAKAVSSSNLTTGLPQSGPLTLYADSLGSVYAVDTSRGMNDMKRREEAPTGNGTKASPAPVSPVGMNAGE